MSGRGRDAGDAGLAAPGVEGGVRHEVFQSSLTGTVAVNRHEQDVLRVVF